MATNRYISSKLIIGYELTLIIVYLDDTFLQEETVSPEVACFADKTTVYSRVLQDPFHLLSRIDLDLSHGCAKAFMRDFSEALFQDNPKDVELMKRHCLYRGWDFDTVRSDRRDFYFKSVRRIIADPVSLHKRVSGVFDLYKDAKDAKTGLQLFNAKAHIQSKNILDLIDAGLISPPDIPLYFVQDEKFAEKADGVNVFYKLECHIRDYKKIYEKSANSADSLRTIRSNRTALSQQRETERVVETIGNQSLLTVVEPVDQRHVAEQASPEPVEELASLTDGDAFQADGDQQHSVLQDVPMATDSVSQEQEIPDSSVPQATVATADSISPMPFVQSHPGTQAHLQLPSASFFPPQMYAFPQFILPNILPNLGQRNQVCAVCGGAACGSAVLASSSTNRASKRCMTCGHTGCKGRGPQPCQFVNMPQVHLPTSRRKRPRAK